VVLNKTYMSLAKGYSIQMALVGKKEYGSN